MSSNHRDESVDGSIREMVTQYLQIKNALANDNGKDAAAAGNAFVASPGRTPARYLKRRGTLSQHDNPQLDGSKNLPARNSTLRSSRAVMRLGYRRSRRRQIWQRCVILLGWLCLSWKRKHGERGLRQSSMTRDDYLPRYEFKLRHYRPDRRYNKNRPH